MHGGRMGVRGRSALFSLLLCGALGTGMGGCRGDSLIFDQPRLAPGTRCFDVTLQSAILGHRQRVRFIVPATIPANRQLPVLYLLHGAASSYRDWSDKTDIAALATHGFVLVMPETDEAFAVNEASPHRHYEDFLIEEVMPAVAHAVPEAAQDRAHTAIVGISRGGLGAAVLGLRHPDRFAYVADLSAVTGLASGRFSWRHPLSSVTSRLRWGPRHSPTRLANNPLILLRAADPSHLPYFLVTVGAEDTLRSADQRWAQALSGRGVQTRFQLVPGGHNWGVWAAEVPLLSEDLRNQIPGAFDDPPAPGVQQTQAGAR